MNSQKLSGAVSCLAAILILAADKIFAPVCKGTMELANGGECMMRCHYYGIALFLFGLLLLAESVLLFFGTHDFKLPVVIIITAVLILLLSNTSIGIGICAKAGMMCHKTALWGRIGAVLAIIGAGISLFVHKSQMPQVIRIHATTFQTEYLIIFPVIYNQESKLSVYAKKPESDR